jgi:hypothetical protein
LSLSWRWFLWFDEGNLENVTLRLILVGYWLLVISCWLLVPPKEGTLDPANIQLKVTSDQQPVTPVSLFLNLQA